MRESIRRTLQTLTDLGVQRVLIVSPTPEFKYDVLQCHSKIKCDTPLEIFEKYRSVEVAIIKEESAAFKNVRLLDPVNTFCSNGNCPQIITNDKGVDIPTVEDDDHVSVQSALFLGRKEAVALEWILFD
jgi:hypothetical protein